MDVVTYGSKRDSWCPFYYDGLTLIPAWISNYIHYKVSGETTYSFLNFKGATVMFKNV